MSWLSEISRLSFDFLLVLGSKDISDTWNCFLSTWITGPSGGKSARKLITKVYIMQAYYIKNQMIFFHFSQGILPMIVMFADSARAKNVGVTVTSQRYVPVSLVWTWSRTTRTWSLAVIWKTEIVVECEKVTDVGDGVFDRKCLNPIVIELQSRLRFRNLY